MTVFRYVQYGLQVHAVHAVQSASVRAAQFVIEDNGIIIEVQRNQGCTMWENMEITFPGLY